MNADIFLECFMLIIDPAMLSYCNISSRASCTRWVMIGWWGERAPVIVWEGTVMVQYGH